MRTTTLLHTAALTVLAILGASCASSGDSHQDMNEMLPSFTNVSKSVLNAEPASPRRRLEADLESVTISVEFGSPSKKGRALWGALVPYDAVWRTGANEATTFESSGDLLVQGQPLPAGRYSVFTIPTATEWTVIFNSQPDQWGAYEYDATRDALRVAATPAESDMAESMEFVAGDAGALTLRWGKLALPILLSPASMN